MAIDESIFSLLAPSDLAGFSQSVQARDPYNIVSQSLNAWQPNYSYMDGTESGITAFGKAFLGGLAGNYAQNRAADQFDSVIKVLPQLTSDPLSVVMPEGVDSTAFNLLRGSAALRKMQKDAIAGDQQKSNVGDLLKTVLGEGVKTGALTPQEAIEAATKGKLPEKLSSSIEGNKNPNSPQYKLDQDIKIEEDKLRKEISSIPSVSQFATMQKSLPLVAGFKDQDSKSSDVGFVFNYIKSLDEGAVRGEEINMANSSNPLIQQYYTQLKSAYEGTSTLTPALKNKMYRELLGAQKNVFMQAKKDAEIVANIGKNRGITNNLYPFDPNLTFNTDMVQIRNPKTGNILNVPADDPRLEQLKAQSVGAPLG